MYLIYSLIPLLLIVFLNWCHYPSKCYIDIWGGTIGDQLVLTARENFSMCSDLVLYIYTPHSTSFHTDGLNLATSTMNQDHQRRQQWLVNWVYKEAHTRFLECWNLFLMDVLSMCTLELYFLWDEIKTFFCRKDRLFVNHYSHNTSRS